MPCDVKKLIYLLNVDICLYSLSLTIDFTSALDSKFTHFAAHLQKSKLTDQWVSLRRLPRYKSAYAALCALLLLHSARRTN